MIRISQLKLPVDHREEDIRNKAAKLLRIEPAAIKSLKLVRQSIDARKKEDIFYIYTVDVETDREAQVIKRARNSQVSLAEEPTAEEKNQPTALSSWEAVRRGCSAALCWHRPGMSP